MPVSEWGAVESLWKEADQRRKGRNLLGMLPGTCRSPTSSSTNGHRQTWIIRATATQQKHDHPHPGSCHQRWLLMREEKASGAEICSDLCLRNGVLQPSTKEQQRQHFTASIKDWESHIISDFTIKLLPAILLTTSYLKSALCLPQLMLSSYTLVNAKHTRGPVQWLIWLILYL